MVDLIPLHNYRVVSDVYGMPLVDGKDLSSSSSSSSSSYHTIRVESIDLVRRVVVGGGITCHLIISTPSEYAEYSYLCSFAIRGMISRISVDNIFTPYQILSDGCPIDTLLTPCVLYCICEYLQHHDRYALMRTCKKFYGDVPLFIGVDDKSAFLNGMAKGKYRSTLRAPIPVKDITYGLDRTLSTKLLGDIMVRDVSVNTGFACMLLYTSGELRASSILSLPAQWLRDPIFMKSFVYYALIASGNHNDTLGRIADMIICRGVADVIWISYLTSHYAWNWQDKTMGTCINTIAMNDKSALVSKMLPSKYVGRILLSIDAVQKHKAWACAEAIITSVLPDLYKWNPEMGFELLSRLLSWLLKRWHLTPYIADNVDAVWNNNLTPVHKKMIAMRLRDINFLKMHSLVGWLQK